MVDSSAKRFFVGLISGTSVDGIDAGVFVFEGQSITLVANSSRDYSPDTKREILALSSPGSNEIDRMGELDRQLGGYFAEAALDVIHKAKLSPEDIEAVGSHGQTIRHRPGFKSPFTLQIADPNLIAEKTGIRCVADLRRRDMAAGGQGAPLAPAFHQAAFNSNDEKRCIVNIGGIANISVLSAQTKNILGYDTGPGNILMDSWISKIQALPYDKDGAWANSGKVDARLLSELMSHPYLNKGYPKALDVKILTSAAEGLLGKLGKISEQDVQASLLEFSAQTIALACRHHGADAVFICGGGANNTALMNRLQEHLPAIPVGSTKALGIHHDWVETGLVAWLAKQTVDGVAGNLPNVTGAAKSVTLGAIYSA